MLSLLVVTALAQLDAGAVEGPPSDAPEVSALPADAPVAEAPLAIEPVVVGETMAPTAGFVKGELSVYLGSDRLVVKNNRIGLSAGLDRFETAFYLLLEPLVDLRFFDGKLGVGFGVPLRLELVNFAVDETGSPLLARRLGRLRTEDWDSVHDFGRVLKYVTWGRKEDPLYISAGQRYASTIGHGALVRRYAPNIDIDYPRASAQVDAYNDFGGFELFTNDLLEWNTLAGIGFIKPLSFLKSENLLAKTLSVGFSGATDWRAPYQLTTDSTTGLRQIDAQGRLLSAIRPVGLIGIDAEVKVLKTANVDLKPYVDYSMLIGGDGGFTAGLLGRFNVGSELVNAFRVVAEFRVLGSRYLPSYFDTFYEIERFIFASEEAPGQASRNALTRQQVVMDRGLGQRLGYYVEASWGIPGKVGLTLAAEGVSNLPNTNLIAHLEVPVLDFFQIFGSYYKRGITTASSIFRIDPQTPDTVFYAGARLKILPFLFVNGRAYQTFRLNPEVRRYDSQLGFVVDVEIGYEFKGKKSETVATQPVDVAPTSESTPATDPAARPQP
ncbi:MAG: hypothetical protein Q8S33_34525 [Myxococcales bacterium]|nr:hypothetical protein [Myxococcales bacterium]